MENLDLKKLISAITPYYNEYRKNRLTILGTDALILMWEIGKLLEEFVLAHNIAPHHLYRLIYGKSEGAQNTIQKSYITRDFLSRSYRIKKLFSKKKEIVEQFPKLKKFRTFYKAMPFIDNPKYKFEGKEKSAIFKLLNSNKPYGDIMKVVGKLQKERIGIKNPRTQKLGEMEGDKKVFVDFYNYIYGMVKFKDYRKVESAVTEVGVDFISLLAKNTSAISADGLKMEPYAIEKTLPMEWESYAKLLLRLISKKEALERRRFRRLIPPERLIRLSEMLFAIRSEEKYNTFKP